MREFFQRVSVRRALMDANLMAPITMRAASTWLLSQTKLPYSRRGLMNAK